MSEVCLKVEDILDRIMPAWREGAQPTWPPDAFIVAASLLKHSGAYTQVVHLWPPKPHVTTEDWQKYVEGVSERWKRAFDPTAPTWPAELQRCWSLVVAHQAMAIDEIAEDRLLIESLMTLLAVADDAGSGWSSISRPDGPMQRLANARLVTDERGTMSLSIHPSRAALLPKMHNPLDGLTLRSLSHNFALWENSEVAVDWGSVSMQTIGEKAMNLLLLPWPLVVKPEDFGTVDVPGETMPESYGFFGYDVGSKTIDVSEVARLKNLAEKRAGGPVAAIVFPECSMTPQQFDEVQKAVRDVAVIAGIGERGSSGDLGANYVAVGMTTATDSFVKFQDKHHRWRLDKGQIARYGLQKRLADKDCWWEAIDVVERRCTFVDVNPLLTFCVLVCEDLARQDPVAELVRSVGPNLVIALLLDGPQVRKRWSARYATVLAEDPRSSVLTLTCAGMVDLAAANDTRPFWERVWSKRSIGLWKDAFGNEVEIELKKGASGVLLQLDFEQKREHVADGRHDYGGTGYLVYRKHESLR